MFQQLAVSTAGGGGHATPLAGAEQYCRGWPSQSLPPYMGRGLVQVRACTPLHTAEHVVSHSDQPPFTGAGGARPIDDDELIEAA